MQRKSQNKGTENAEGKNEPPTNLVTPLPSARFKGCSGLTQFKNI